MMVCRTSNEMIVCSFDVLCQTHLHEEALHVERGAREHHQSPVIGLAN